MLTYSESNCRKNIIKKSNFYADIVQSSFEFMPV